MPKAKAIAKPGPLGELVTSEVSIALPEIVAVFLSKYETDLYDKKSQLTKELSTIQKQLDAHDKAVQDNAKFDEYIGIKVPKLGLISVVSQEPKVDWGVRAQQVTCTICLADADNPQLKNHHTRSGYQWSKTFQKKIFKKDIQEHDRLIELMHTVRDELAKIVGAITDMSRKERQVKAAISERTLKEKGLEDFVNSPEMLELIKID